MTVSGGEGEIAGYRWRGEGAGDWWWGEGVGDGE
jgi:hypothetical protein